MDRQIITVDIAPRAFPTEHLRVSQNDVGRPLGVRVTQNGLPLDCSDYTAFLYVLKPDHNYYECTCTVEDDSLICWETAEQETPIAGECLAAIRIMDQDHDIGTATFVEYVEASPADLGYASQSLISSMTEFVDAAQRAAEEATTAVADVDNVNDVAVDASGHIVLSKVLGSTVTSDETVLQPGDIENDLLATTAGKVLDATQGKALQDTIDGINNQISVVTITNEYSTILSAINAYRSVKKFPFCINKSGTAEITDLPSNVTNTCEWNVVCFGSSQRLTAKLTIFSGGGSQNGQTYTANIFTGSYYFNWAAPDVGIRKASYTVTTNASGVVNVVAQAGIVPIGYIAPNNVILTFFRANAYWYIRATNDNGVVFANTEIAFQLIYLNESYI